jgi:hypothetical protein
LEASGADPIKLGFEDALEVQDGRSLLVAACDV